MLILDSQVIGFRNSLSEDALYLSFQKLAFWTTGKWGKNGGELIETGKLSSERIYDTTNDHTDIDCSNTKQNH